MKIYYKNDIDNLYTTWGSEYDITTLVTKNKNLFEDLFKYKHNIYIKNGDTLQYFSHIKYCGSEGGTNIKGTNYTIDGIMEEVDFEEAKGIIREYNLNKLLD